MTDILTELEEKMRRCRGSRQAPTWLLLLRAKSEITNLRTERDRLLRLLDEPGCLGGIESEVTRLVNAGKT